MADFNQFGSAKPPQSANAQHCAQCEAMLVDVLDGTLAPSDQATFDLHVASCSDCTVMLADARRGVAWLEMLKPHCPEPSSALLDRIFANTIGETSIQTSKVAESVTQPNTLLGVPALSPATPALYPAVATARAIPFRQRLVNVFRIDSIRQTLMQPRLAMTAAMAFFSIALTLNLTGVRLTQLRASDLKPSSIKRAFYETNARVVRTFDNMRVVYELESRVRDLQRASDNETPAPAPQNQNDSAPRNQQPSGDQQSPSQKPQNDQENPDHKQAAPRPKSGTSRRESPEGRLLYVGSISGTPGQPVGCGRLSGRGTPPAATNKFIVFATNVYKNQQQGGLV